MGAELPEIGRREFVRRVRRVCPESLSSEAVERLLLHYSELRRWNRRLSLVSPLEGEDLVKRHYGESLAALPLLSARVRVLVDVGSGAGFPGLVLAAARSDLDVTLVEARERKWSFLMTVCRKAALSCTCLNARVGRAPVEGLPPQIDVVTSRAVRSEDLGLEVLLPHLAPDGAVLLWSGAARTELPRGFELRREVMLPGSENRRISEIVRPPGREHDR